MKVPIPMEERLTNEKCPRTQEEIEDMECVPYASFVDSLMYVMVCTRLDISHAVGVLSRYILTPKKEKIQLSREYLCHTKYYAIF